MSSRPETSPPGPKPWSIGDYLPLVVVAVGWVAMFLPVYLGLAETIWSSDDAQGHGPIILAVSMWLLWQKKDALAAVERKPMPVLAGVIMLTGAVAYIVGRSQTVWTLEISAQLFVLIALLLMFFGPRGLKTVWFPLLFLVFMIPWPGGWVDAVTGPLKAAVSTIASWMLYHAGYPVGRSGVILTVGQYQLLVADACAGLNSLFTLEAVGLLYMNLMQYTSPARNVVLAILIVPISFVANVVRVMILILVTYHFGDEAGQGFVHSFAGIVLFMVALTLILIADRIVGLVLPKS